MTGHTPPHSLEAEESLLACAINDGAASIVEAINRQLTPECFYDSRNRTIYERLLAMLSAGKPIDYLTLSQELGMAKELTGIGGYPYLTKITSAYTATSAQAPFFVDKIRECAALRTVIREATGLVENAYNYTGQGIADMLGRPLDRLLAVSSGGDAEKELSMPELVDAALESAQSIIENRGMPKNRAIDYPWPQMTELFGPMMRGELIIIAGNASMGKSSFFRQVITGISRQGFKTYVDILEVQPIQYVLQMAATQSRTGLRQLGKAHVADQEDFKQALRNLVKSNITISRRDRWLAQVIAKAKTLKARYGLDAFGIDYGGLLKDVASASAPEKVGAIGRVTSSCKEIAGELDCVCLLLWQLNRGNAKDGVHRQPVLADLRGSGDLEQDCDAAILISRPDTNPLNGETQGPDKSVFDMPRYYTDVIKAKGRDFGVGSIGMYLNRSIASFEEIK